MCILCITRMFPHGKSETMFTLRKVIFRCHFLWFRPHGSNKNTRTGTCVDHGLNHGVSLEALLRALVLRQGQGIRGGGPAHHVHHLLTSR